MIYKTLPLNDPEYVCILKLYDEWFDQDIEQYSIQDAPTPWVSQTEILEYVQTYYNTSPLTYFGISLVGRTNPNKKIPYFETVVATTFIEEKESNND